MKTLIFGADPPGSLHAYLLHNASKDEMIELGNEFINCIN